MSETVAIPAALIDALVQIALRTETGAALVHGYRLAVPAVAPERGQVAIVVSAEAIMKVVSVGAMG
jgi:hypothetical protein